MPTTAHTPLRRRTAVLAGTALELCLLALPAAFALAEPGRAVSNPLLLVWIPGLYLLWHAARGTLPLPVLREERGLWLLPLVWAPSLLTLGPAAAWREGKTFLLGLVALSAVAERVRRNPAALDRALWTLTAIGGLLGLDTLWQWAHGTDLLMGNPLHGPRATATFENPNNLAPVLAAALPAALALLAGKRRGAATWAAAGAAAVTLAAVILTGTRSAWIAALAALALAAPVFRSAPRGRWRLAAVSAAALAALAAGRRLLALRIHRLVGMKDARIDLWQESWPFIKSAPLLGRGIHASQATLPTPTAAGHLTFPHNFFLEIAVESGLPAVAVFLYALWRAARTYGARLWADPRRRVLLGLALCPFLAFVVNAAFFSRHVGTLLWWCLGLAVGAAAPVRPSNGTAA
ncbi:O-antigen ligase family protein [Dissulfurirhabdus thermomarina]|uniref:O-antigen ligase family protein n=1 Tax=Dissulfurirhabdus thermomarina TaxID=1765737 RepID=A0A6N9TL73_DISTH|nr:O-antigen ligase family protein [Dissulfurirhabdus thermomarina]NDY41869.1 O-antigen ligase family protein [Dissulfurirhabdus thermomarina]NMX22570.1 O-antigen ligase family protein [Dissulfurirhabdus thermomarina]